MSLLTIMRGTTWFASQRESRDETVLPNWSGGTGGWWTAKQFGLAIHAPWPTHISAAAILGAGLILTVVIRHMLANSPNDVYVDSRAA